MSADAATTHSFDEEHPTERWFIGTFEENRVNAEWDRANEQLDHIQTLRQNWDGAGSNPISSDITETARDFLRCLSKEDPSDPPSNVLASPNGSVVIEWHTHSSYRVTEVEGIPGDIEWVALETMIRSQDNIPVHSTHYFPRHSEGSVIFTQFDDYSIRIIGR